VPDVFDQNSRTGFDRFTIRGFFAGDSVFLDGLRTDPRFWIRQELFEMERIEVLKGRRRCCTARCPGRHREPRVQASALRRPPYDVGLSIGSYDFYEGTFDLGATLNADKTIAVRAVGLYLDRNDFVDFVEKQRAYFAPSVTFKLGADTTITLLLSCTWDDWVQPVELPAQGTVLPNPNGKIPSSDAWASRASTTPRTGGSRAERSWRTGSTRTSGCGTSCGASTTRWRTTASAASSSSRTSAR
jgi:iron complex outermembrane receptor protein